jgi:hypothetical protein
LDGLDRQFRRKGHRSWTAAVGLPLCRTPTKKSGSCAPAVRICRSGQPTRSFASQPGRRVRLLGNPVEETVVSTCRPKAFGRATGLAQEHGLARDRGTA